MRWRLCCLVAASTALALAACGSVTAPKVDAGMDDTEDASTDADPGDAGQAACGGGNQCVSIPEGWAGHAQNNCSGTSATLTVTEAGSACITKQSQTSFQTTSITPNSAAACAKQGGILSGAAGPTQPTTICCR